MKQLDKGTLIRLKRSAQLAEVSTHDNILDLGCGDSLIKEFIPSIINYTGIDINSADIKYDLERGLPNNILYMKYDTIFINEFIEHIENFKSLLIQCKSVLKHDGSIILSTPSNNRILIKEDQTHIHCFRKTNMVNLIGVCGMKIDKILGSYIRFPPLFPYYVILETKQTIYTEVILYKIIKYQDDNYEI